MKIYLDTLGCRLNQAEIEQFARQFRAAGHSLVADPSQADLAVVNTCAVTAAAESDSRQKIRQVARLGAAQVAVTGCWVTLRPEEAAALPKVGQVINNQEKDHLVADLLGQQPETFEIEPVEREPIPGARLRTRAFIKVQDGCNNRCTFCITTVARGAGRSQSAATVLGDIQAALDGGAQEIVLTGVHLGSWGQDLPGSPHLYNLIQSILRETDTQRLRLSSLEPWDLPQDFFELWQDKRLCRHLHLPLQSGSAATLRRMARKITPESFAHLLVEARQASPEIAITTDVIAGFPGESEAEFQESLAFIQEMNFAGGHVFTYSERSGTAAARMGGQVPLRLRKERNAQVRAALEAAAIRYQTRFIGQVLPVLWESATAYGPQGWSLSGLSDNYLRISAIAPQHLWNQVTPVVLQGIGPEGLRGQLSA